MAYDSTLVDSVEYRPAVPEDYPGIARLLARNFHGKFALALGRDAAKRQRFMETLIAAGVVCHGLIYVAYAGDALAGSVTFNTAASHPTPAMFDRARETLAGMSSRWRAWWAIAILRRFDALHLQPGEIYIDNLVVSREFRGHGIGIRFQHYLEIEAKQQNCPTLLADIMSSNSRALNLMSKAGWTIIERNYWMAPITWPLMGTAGVVRICKQLQLAEKES